MFSSSIFINFIYTINELFLDDIVCCLGSQICFKQLRSPGLRVTYLGEEFLLDIWSPDIFYFRNWGLSPRGSH